MASAAPFIAPLPDFPDRRVCQKFKWIGCLENRKCLVRELTGWRGTGECDEWSPDGFFEKKRRGRISDKAEQIDGKDRGAILRATSSFPLAMAADQVIDLVEAGGGNHKMGTIKGIGLPERIRQNVLSPVSRNDLRQMNNSSSCRSRLGKRSCRSTVHEE